MLNGHEARGRRRCFTIKGWGLFCAEEMECEMHDGSTDMGRTILHTTEFVGRGFEGGFCAACYEDFFCRQG